MAKFKALGFRATGQQEFLQDGTMILDDSAVQHIFHRVFDISDKWSSEILRISDEISSGDL